MTFFNNIATAHTTTSSARVFQHLADVSDLDWGSMRRPAGVYQTAGWWAMTEQMAPNAVRYITAQDGKGRLHGITPLYLFGRGNAAGYYDPAIALGASTARALNAEDRNVAILGGRAGYLTGWSIKADHADLSTVLSCVVKAADQIASELGINLLSVQYLPRHEAELLVQTGAVDPDEIVLQNFATRIAIAGGGFENYLESMSAGRRSIVRRDLQAFQKSQCTLDVMRLSESMQFAPELLSQVQTRHGAAADVALMRHVLQSQSTWLDELSVLIVSRDEGGTPIAYSLSYVVDDTLYVRLVGLDHERARKSASYFVTAYYEPVRLAYRQKLKSVHLGIGSIRPKILRGAQPEPLYAVFRGRDRKRVDPQSRLAAEERLRAHLADQMGNASQVPDAAFVSKRPND